MNCSPGYFSQDWAFFCSPCDRGNYQNLSGQGSCIACPVNTFSDVSGAVSCNACPQGTTSGVGASICFLSGFTEGPLSTRTTSVPSSYYTQNPNATSSDLVTVDFASGSYYMVLTALISGLRGASLNKEDVVDAWCDLSKVFFESRARIPVANVELTSLIWEDSTQNSVQVELLFSRFSLEFANAAYAWLDSNSNTGSLDYQLSALLRQVEAVTGFEVTILSLSPVRFDSAGLFNVQTRAAPVLVALTGFSLLALA